MKATEINTSKFNYIYLPEGYAEKINNLIENKTLRKKLYTIVGKLFSFKEDYFLMDLHNYKNVLYTPNKSFWVDYSKLHNTEISKAKKILKMIGVIDIEYHSYNYLPGSPRFSKMCQINEEFLNSQNSEFIEVSKSKPLIKFKIGKNLKISEKYLRTFKNIDLDVEAALNAEFEYHQKNDTSLNSLNHRINSILNFNVERYISKGKKSNRISSSLTYLSKVSREFLTYKNKKFNYVDLKNSQPTLFILFCKERGFILDENYIKDCEEGLLYDKFIGLTLKHYIFDGWRKNTYTTVNRKQVKSQFFSSLFFNWKPGFEINKIFKETYNKTWNVLKEHHQTNNDIKLAGLLQRKEAEIFLNIIPKKSKGYFTIHDSIYYTDEADTTQIEEEIKDHFNKYNINITLKKN